MSDLAVLSLRSQSPALFDYFEWFDTCSVAIALLELLLSWAVFVYVGISFYLFLASLYSGLSSFLLT